jgi:type VI secretion system protein ImpG
MDERFLQYYERELRYMREQGAEFAQQFPKIAGRLGLSELECADPHVERLLEAFSFMAARVHLKLDAEFSRFTQQLLNLVYPHYTAPTPSMAVVQLLPAEREGALREGCLVPRDSVLRARLGKRDQALCEYRTKRDVTLWPIEVEAVEYSSLLHDLAELRTTRFESAKAFLRVRLRTCAGLRFSQLGLDRLPLFVRGADEVSFRLHEQLCTSALGLVVRPVGRAAAEATFSEPALRPLGFEANEALLPYPARSFQGYRLLHEYFAFPSAFSFVELLGLGPGVRRADCERIDVLIPLERFDPLLEAGVDAQRLLPFAVPAINLFSRECDRVRVTEHSHELHVVPDRTRPLDLEVHTISKVVGYGSGSQAEREFTPLYAARDRIGSEPAAYYTCERRPRELSSQHQRSGARSEYTGSELFLTLADGRAGSHKSDLRQLGVTALCTNRDLPLLLKAAGPNASEFSLVSGAPVAAIRCLAGPSAPRATPSDGDTGWRLLSHLSLNYLSLCDADTAHGAEALRELLALYAELGDPSLHASISGLRSVASRPLLRPLPGPGPLAFGRGLEITVECQERAFQGTGVFGLAAVLAQFFAKYASINSFTETVLRTVERGEVYRWPTTAGLRPAL